MGKLKDILFKAELSAEVKNIQDRRTGMKRAYAETYQILMHATQEVTLLIPTSFMEFLRENMDATRINHLDFSKNLMEMDLSKTTRVLLSLVYRDFLCQRWNVRHSWIKIVKRSKPLAKCSRMNRCGICSRTMTNHT